MHGKAIIIQFSIHQKNELTLKHTLTALKVIISFGLIYFVTKKFDYHQVIDELKNISVFHVLSGLLISLVIVLLQGLRWKILLLKHGNSITFPFLLKYILYGYALNLAVPLGVGADIIKSYSLGKVIEAKSESIGSIVFAKILGLSMMMLLMWVSLPFSSRELLPESTYLPLSIISLLVFLFSLITIFKSNWVAKFIPFKVFKASIHHIQATVKQPKTLGLALMYSFLIQILISIIQLLFYQGVGAEISFWDNAIYFSVLSLLLYLPISIGGVGLREATSIYILGQLSGVSDSHCLQVSLLAYLLMVFQAFLGLLTYILIPKEARA